jgi:pimeloyl-ACP methyl ester carboxylesterase
VTIEAFRQSNPALELAGSLAIALGQSVPMALRPQDEVLIADADEFRFGPGQSRLGWSIGDGPTAILVHGYSGRGVQMAALAREIAKQGFRAVFFDAGGHGASDPEKIGFSTFVSDTRDIVRHIGGPIYAMIGHSAGGLAMMRARALHDARAEKYAVIAAPLFPYVPLETMQKRGASEDALQYVKAILADQFQTTWSSLAAGIAFEPEPGKPLLAIYDRSDERIRHSDADVLGERWPGATVRKTEGYGHNRVLQAPETLEAISRFLAR